MILTKAFTKGFCLDFFTFFDPALAIAKSAKIAINAAWLKILIFLIFFIFFVFIILLISVYIILFVAIAIELKILTRLVSKNKYQTYQKCPEAKQNIERVHEQMVIKPPLLIITYSTASRTYKNISVAAKAKNTTKHRAGKTERYRTKYFRYNAKEYVNVPKDRHLTEKYKQICQKPRLDGR
ncbi:MAG: hypothetical protein LBR45_03325 [Bacteroidales bacterium]|nr:hypothetical protein [Bacteroidales bacterium]